MEIFDLHIDLSSFCLTSGRGSIENKNRLGDFFLPDQVDIPRLKKGKVKILLANICPILATPQGFELPENSINETMRQINFYKTLKGINLIDNLNSRLKGISALLSIEGAYFIEQKKDLALLIELRKLGVVSISPTWNIDNALGTGAGNQNSKTGLTRLGQEFIEMCEDTGIIIDAVHSSRATFKDIASFSKKPFFVSHTASYTVNNHRRNLKDTEIRRVANSGGIIGLSFIKDFIGGNSINLVTKHLKHLLNVAGEDHVAIGSDFDGMGQGDLIRGIEDIGMMQGLFEFFKMSGINNRILEKVACKNAQKFFRDSLK
ncbi:MAG TPA: membrane dipeptidase [Patescibacteria group bacterium]|nr:membrane dipeptidase [Patescibacteria group bacterium]